MTPRKEIFKAAKTNLALIPELEYIDLHRGQFERGEDNRPQYYTAGLIKIPTITWEMMTQHRKEGTATLEIYFYCKDGWMDQFEGTSDPDDGLTEIDLIDKIVDALQFIYGEYFKPLQQSGDSEHKCDVPGMMAYKITFTSKVYQLVKPPYTLKKLSL